jgi:hypothetical protein
MIFDSSNSQRATVSRFPFTGRKKEKEVIWPNDFFLLLLLLLSGNSQTRKTQRKETPTPKQKKELDLLFLFVAMRKLLAPSRIATHHESKFRKNRLKSNFAGLLCCFRRTTRKNFQLTSIEWKIWALDVTTCDISLAFISRLAHSNKSKQQKTNSHLLSCRGTLPLLLCHNFTFPDGARSLRWGTREYYLCSNDTYTRKTQPREEKKAFLQWTHFLKVFKAKKRWMNEVLKMEKKKILRHRNCWRLEDVNTCTLDSPDSPDSNCTKMMLWERKSNKQSSHQIRGVQGGSDAMLAAWRLPFGVGQIPGGNEIILENVRWIYFSGVLGKVGKENTWRVECMLMHINISGDAVGWEF